LAPLSHKLSIGFLVSHGFFNGFFRE